MARTITVNGISRLSVKPDTISIFLTLNNIDADYENAISASAKSLNSIKKRVEEVGFNSTDVKTINFNVRTEYETEYFEGNRRKNVFKGYNCCHSLKLEFPIDTERLAKTLASIARADADPELSIAFTVGESDKIKDELLSNAAENARKKAEILCSASGAKLGELVSIKYDCGDLNLISGTSYNMDRNCLRAAKMDCTPINVNPEDIELKDNALFEWEII